MARVDIRYGYGSFGSVSSGTSDNHDGIGAQLFQAALGPELVPWSNRRGPHASVPAEGRVDGPDLGGSWVGVEGVAAGVGLRVDSCFSPFGLLRRVVLRSHQAVVVPLGFWDSQVLAVLSDGFQWAVGEVGAARSPAVSTLLGAAALAFFPVRLALGGGPAAVSADGRAVTRR